MKQQAWIYIGNGKGVVGGMGKQFKGPPPYLPAPWWADKRGWGGIPSTHTQHNPWSKAGAATNERDGKEATHTNALRTVTWYRIDECQKLGN